MATVIADTSPLQYLFQLGLLDVLHELYGNVLVPEAVRDELLVGRSLGIDVQIRMIPMAFARSHAYQTARIRTWDRLASTL